MKLEVAKPVRNYESVIIMHPDCTEEEQKAFFQKNKKILSDYSGEFTSVETWGRRKLGNPIKKLKMGLYFHSFFTAKAESIEELERTMRINDKILRFVHNRLDDRASINDHIKSFQEVIEASRRKEQEREEKNKKKMAARRGPRPN